MPDLRTMRDPAPAISFPVREFTDYSLFRFPPGGGDLIESVVTGLMEDFVRRRDRGEPHQLVPGISAPNAENPELLDVGDGRHRFEANRRLEFPFLTQVRPEPFRPGEVNQIRVSSLLKRKKPSPFELCEIVTRHKAELDFAMWKLAADHLGIPTSTMSSITCVRRIPEDLRPSVAAYGPRLVRDIARLKGRAEMERAIKYAAGEGGTPPAVEQVELFIKREINGVKPRGRKPKQLKLKADGGIELAISGMDTPTLVTTDGGILLLIPAATDYEVVEADLKTALSRVRRGKRIGEAEVPPVLLPA